MAPIYESDLAEERYAQTEWNHYELWEKVEVRLRRHRRLWIAGTVVLFLLLSSVPIVLDQRPKWATLGAVRGLGEELNRMKREAALDRAAFRLVFAGGGSLAYRVEKATSCEAGVAGAPVREGVLPGGSLVLLEPRQGEALGLQGLLESFCYDPIVGSSLAQGTHGFAVIPAGDLTVARSDRLSVLVLGGASGEVSFE
ncbi:MAG: hypothetical protein NDJ89_01625 [Oligoflexia bacterium]|nr:hypothetical protein [Oligoflexia bacterium]